MMKFFQFSVQGNRIVKFIGEVDGANPDFNLYEKSFGVEEIYYKLIGGKVSEVTCEAFNKISAEKAVTDFLSRW